QSWYISRPPGNIRLHFNQHPWRASGSGKAEAAARRFHAAAAERGQGYRPLLKLDVKRLIQLFAPNDMWLSLCLCLPHYARMPCNHCFCDVLIEQCGNVVAVPEDTTAQPPRKVRVTPIVLRDASRWRGVNHKFISLGIKFERAVAVDAGIRIIPKSEDDYRRIIRLFREEEVPHHTFPLPSERNIHAVIRGVHATLSEIEIKEELQQRGYSPCT
ncbi:unnamed protein product, partial [Acanthoscelides obtectus]